MVWSLCLLLGFSLYVSGSGEVLCFGDQGHVMIEPTHLQSCCESEHSSPASSLQLDGHHQHDCVQCSDIPIDSPQWRRPKAANGPSIIPFDLPKARSLKGQVTVVEAGSGHNRTIASGKSPTGPTATLSAILRC